MSTLFTHVVIAFVLLALINRLFRLSLSEEILFLFSCAAILPDVIDKPLTGQRYFCHSLVFSTILFILIIFLVYYITRDSNKVIYCVLIGVAFLSHIFLDLASGVVYLLWPLDINGVYHLDVEWVMIQTIHIPPLFDSFHIQLLRYEKDFSPRYGSLGEFVSPLDFISMVMIGFILFFYCFYYAVCKIKLYQSRENND